MSYLYLRALPAERRAVEDPKLAQQLEQLLDENVEFDPGSLSRNEAGARGSRRETVATFLDDGRTYPLDLERVELHPNNFICLGRVRDQRSDRNCRRYRASLNSNSDSCSNTCHCSQRAIRVDDFGESAC